MARMEHTFARVPSANIPRSVFNRTHGHKTTFNAGYLVPIYVDEALPGDTFNLQLHAFARLATPLLPIMDNLYLDFYFFAVPNRLLWENWQRFMGERDPDPDSSIDYSVPVVHQTSNWGLHSLADYFGIPTYVTGIDTNALPFRAYNLIWNEWFRDQNLQDSVPKNVDDGDDSPADYVLLRGGKRHDYFTSCLPWPQKGDDVVVPIGDSAPVIASGSTVPLFRSSGVGEGPLIAPTSVGDQNVSITRPAGGPGASQSLYWGTATGLEADLENATGATINSLRAAFQLQRFFERDARGGTRYTEILRNHFGVISPDARLQRPEFLGGGTVPVNIHPIAQTSESGTGPTSYNSKGSLAAFGTAAAKGIGFTKSFVEHCTLIGLVKVRADLNYQQGLNRMWFRETRYDYYWPAFANLGEQEVYNKEIYYQGDPGSDPGQDDAIFGYQERYAEYRYFPSLITGQLRSTATTPLDAWHLAQEFNSLPTLSSTFIEENPPVNRVVAVTSEPQFIFDSLFTIRAARPMPMYGVPGLIDHF